MSVILRGYAENYSITALLLKARDSEKNCEYKRSLSNTSFEIHPTQESICSLKIWYFKSIHVKCLGETVNGFLRAQIILNRDGVGIASFGGLSVGGWKCETLRG